MKRIALFAGLLAGAVSFAVGAPLLHARDSLPVPDPFVVAGRAAVEDSAAVAAVVHRFHRALETADSATALALLTDDALILESGGVETKEEYRGHHLPADIAFARAVRRESGPVRVVVRGDVAWATSTSTARGVYRGREIDSRGAELMVLVRTAAGWRISVIHWSSRRG